MNEAHFSNIERQITETLVNAKNHVDVAMAWFTNNNLFESLLDCLGRGVSVRLILLDDQINWMPYAPDFNRYVNSGGKLYVADRSMGFLHHKFCVVDGNSLITGSYNWTYYAENRNLENIIISNDISLCNHFSEEFNRLVGRMNPVYNVEKVQWEDIHESLDFNIEEMNYEIESISKARKLPKVDVATHSTVVQILHTENRFVAEREIGIVTEDEVWSVFIEKGEELPHSTENKFYMDNRSSAELRCEIAQRLPDSGNLKVIMTVPFAQIACAEKDESEISIKITLNENGYLHMQITNLDNKKSLDCCCINRNLVKAEKK